MQIENKDRGQSYKERYKESIKKDKEINKDIASKFINEDIPVSLDLR